MSAPQRRRSAAGELLADGKLLDQLLVETGIVESVTDEIRDVMELFAQHVEGHAYLVVAEKLTEMVEPVHEQPTGTQQFEFLADIPKRYGTWLVYQGLGAVSDNLRERVFGQRFSHALKKFRES